MISIKAKSGLYVFKTSIFALALFGSLSFHERCSFVVVPTAIAQDASKLREALKEKIESQTTDYVFTDLPFPGLPNGLGGFKITEAEKRDGELDCPKKGSGATSEGSLFVDGKVAYFTNLSTCNYVQSALLQKIKTAVTVGNALNDDGEIVPRVLAVKPAE